MTKMKKISLVIISLILVVACVSCNANATWILKTKKEEVPVGLYICTLADANAEAESKVNEQITPAEEPSTEAKEEEAETTTVAAETTTKEIDYSKHKIDGKDFDEWVKNRSVELVKELVAAEEKAEELKVELGPEVDESIDSYWEYYGDFYTKLGVSETSFRRYFRGNYLKDEVKYAYYGEDGKEPISKKELKAALKENYVSVYSLQLSKSTTVTGEDGNTTYGTYDEKILKKLRNIMDKYADALQKSAKTDYDKIEKEFQDETNEICGIDPSANEDAESNQVETTVDSEDGENSSKSKLKATDNIQVYNDVGEDNDETTANLVKAKVGKAGWFETDGVFVVYLRTNDINENPYYHDNYTKDLINKLKEDDFKKLLEDWAKELGAKVNSNATKAYTFKLYEKAEKENQNQNQQ
jgi:hypothetical protein